VLSIIICTFNRSGILDICLEHIVEQLPLVTGVTILVIDNNSSDNTKSVVEKYQKETPLIRYYLEPKQGLSHARNRGYQEAKADWVGYLDDDSIIEKDFLKESLLTIQEEEFDVFGGKITPWFKYGKPRWLNDNFETNISKDTQKGPIEPTRIWGGVMFFKRAILVEVNGFSPDLGMNGTKIAYGEESHLIKLIQENGYNLGSIRQRKRCRFS